MVKSLFAVLKLYPLKLLDVTGCNFSLNSYIITGVLPSDFVTILPLNFISVSLFTPLSIYFDIN